MSKLTEQLLDDPDCLSRKPVAPKAPSALSEARRRLAESPGSTLIVPATLLRKLIEELEVDPFSGAKGGGSFLTVTDLKAVGLSPQDGTEQPKGGATKPGGATADPEVETGKPDLFTVNDAVVAPTATPEEELQPEVISATMQSISGEEKSVNDLPTPESEGAGKPSVSPQLRQALSSVNKAKPAPARQAAAPQPKPFGQETPKVEEAIEAPVHSVVLDLATIQGARRRKALVEAK